MELFTVDFIIRGETCIGGWWGCTAFFIAFIVVVAHVFLPSLLFLVLHTFMQRPCRIFRMWEWINFVDLWQRHCFERFGVFGSQPMCPVAMLRRVRVRRFSFGDDAIFHTATTTLYPRSCLHSFSIWSQRVTFKFVCANYSGGCFFFFFFFSAENNLCTILMCRNVM